MNALRILVMATAIELCGLAALLALLGAGGAGNGWLDLLNVAAPLFLLLALIGLILARIWLRRTRIGRLCLALALLSAGFEVFLIAPDLIGLISPAAPGGVPYRLVTANVARQNDSPFSAAKDLARRGADAVLVEDSEGTIQRANTIFERVYPYATDCPDMGAQIWVKTPILARGCGLQLDEREPTWGRAFVWITTMGPDGRPITLVAVHLGRPYQPLRQQLERQAVAGALARMPKDRMVLAGDFNTPPWTFAMRGQDRMFAPLRRRTRLWASWPARINLLQKTWPLPFLPIDHIYTGAQWGAAALTRFPVAGSDHFGTEAMLTLRR